MTPHRRLHSYDSDDSDALRGITRFPRLRLLLASPLAPLSGEQLGCWVRGRYLPVPSTPGISLDARASGWAWSPGLSVSRNGSLMGRPLSGPSITPHGSFMAERAAAPAASKVEAARIVRMQKSAASLANPARGSLSNLKNLPLPLRLPVKPTGNLKSPLKCQCPRYGPPGPALQWQWRRLRGRGCAHRHQREDQVPPGPVRPEGRRLAPF